MTAVQRALRKLTPADGVLVGLAVVGGLLYVLLMPGQHPDAAAHFNLGKDGARESADAFLARSGYAVEDVDPDIELRRQTSLLNALQEARGRRETHRVLRDPDATVQLPAYYWRVSYRDVGEEDEDEERYVVRLTQEGAVWEFEQRAPTQRTGRLSSERRVDRNALEAAFAPVPSFEETEDVTRVDFSTLSDSLIAASLSFNPEDSLWQHDPATLEPFDGSIVSSVLARYSEDRDVDLDFRLMPSLAVVLARYHLDRLAWANDALHADSVWLVAERDNRVAGVRFVNEEPVQGQQIRTEVEVSAAGALQELSVDFKPTVEQETPTLGIVGDLMGIVFFVVFGLVLVVMFARRITARLIDGKAAFFDAAAVALLMAVFIGLSKDVNIVNGVDSVWLELLGVLLAASLGGAAVGLFALVISGVTDSLARGAWSKKLRSASMVRLGAFRNVFVGSALLRGTNLAFLLLGLLAGWLFLFPGARIDFQNTQFLDAIARQPMVWRTAGIGVMAFIVTTIVVLGIGTVAYRFRGKIWLVLGAIIVSMAVVQGAPLELNPIGYSWGLSALWGAVLGFTLWRYDFLTSIVGYFLAYLIISLEEGWLVESSPMWLDVLLLSMLVGGLIVLGVIGVVSGQTRHTPAEYVPSYITDMKREERVKGELEIARQIQESFLPRRMPDVPGLDIAAMCLAALEVGGDYYDFVKVGPGRLAVVVGDVSGKGTQAAFYMTLAKGILQTLSREGLPPAEVMRRLNTLFCENVPRGTFISMIYGVFDVQARTFTFARAGHNPVILKRSPSQEPDLVQPTGLGIGLISGSTFDETIEEITLDLRIGDVLVFYTDGFSEAMNRSRDLYGDDRLARKVSDVGQRSANEILRAVTEDVHHFVEAAGRHDDMTMVVVKLERRVEDVAASSALGHIAAEA